MNSGRLYLSREMMMGRAEIFEKFALIKQVSYIPADFYNVVLGRIVPNKFWLYIIAINANRNGL